MPPAVAEPPETDVSSDGGAPDGGPLAGVRVLDLTAYLSGPFATHQLGDLGAEVVKVEPPEGEPTRAGAGMRPGEPPSPLQLGLHRDRSGVVVQLKAAAGRELFLRLAEHADVLVENFRPGITARLGITYDAVRERNGRLIYCSITGYGGEGPAAGLAAIDGPVQARAGVSDYTGDGGGNGPLPLTIADIAGGVTAVQGVLASLYLRERTGRGCHIDVSLLESVLQWTAVADRRRSLAPPVTLVGVGSDGGAFVVQTPMHFQDRLVEVVAAVPGCEHVGSDPRFETREARRQHPEAYQTVMIEAFRRLRRDQWLEEFRRAGVPAGPVQGVDEALVDRQIVHRGAAVEFDAPGLGSVRVPQSPFVFDGRRKSGTSPPPALGEHTRQVLRDWLGVDDEQMASLAAAGAFGGWEPT